MGHDMTEREKRYADAIDAGGNAWTLDSGTRLCSDFIREAVMAVADAEMENLQTTVDADLIYQRRLEAKLARAEGLAAELSAQTYRDDLGDLARSIGIRLTSALAD